MLRSGQVIEIWSTFWSTYTVLDRYRDESGEEVVDRYDCADNDELLSVLDALGCDFEALGVK